MSPEATRVGVNLPTLEQRYSQVRRKIETAGNKSGRLPEEITMVAVSKAIPIASVDALYSLGHRHFGENRVESGKQKIVAARETFEKADDPIVWHMIGHIQRRKVQNIFVGFDRIHSLDSVRLAKRLSRFAEERNKKVPLLLECNVSGEQSKHGFPADDCALDSQQWESLVEAVVQIVELPYLEILGLMTIAPIVPNPEAARPHFAALRKLRDRLSNDFPDTCWDQLSMGMSDDFEVAIEEGATLLRIGRALFGERQQGYR